MKIPVQPIAAAVSLVLISVSAHAQLAAPAIGTAAPPNDGLYLSVWDANGNNSEIVNLGYEASAITQSSGVLTPNSATSPFTTALNPATGVGSVLQLNFGTIPDFSTLFTSANIGTTDFMVTGAEEGAKPYAEVTYNGTPPTAYSGLTGLTNGIQGELAGWQGDSTVSGSGVAADTTGTTTWSVQTGELHGGQILSGQLFGGSVGSALDFFSLNGDTTTHKLTTTQYTNANGAGFWFLSDSGDLSWNVASAATAPVPLPPAVWLFGSGLLGLAGIGRRRRAAA